LLVPPRDFRLQPNVFSLANQGGPQDVLNVVRMVAAPVRRNVLVLSSTETHYDRGPHE